MPACPLTGDVTARAFTCRTTQLPDSAEKVLSFYRKQLSKYERAGVHNGKPVDAVPSQLKCDSDKDDNSIELKAGSERKQHMVSVAPPLEAPSFKSSILTKHHTANDKD